MILRKGSAGKFACLSLILPLVLLLSVLSLSPASAQPPPGDINTGETSIPTDTWAVVLAPNANPVLVAVRLGYENLGQIGTLSNTYLFRVPRVGVALASAQTVASALANTPEVTWFQQQFGYRPYLRNPSDDPLYPNQWHLNNTISGVVGEDANVIPAWNAGYTGTGVQIAIVDDGLEYTHADIAPLYVPQASWDVNGNDAFPSPDVSSDYHGTEVGGVAASADNTTCGVGVAYTANLSGIRLEASSANPTDADEANGLNYANGIAGNTGLTNDIYNNSWGPNDDGQVLKGPGPLTLQALQNGVTSGRGGLGSIFVWAAGNGLQNWDNINADGYANSRFVIAVGGVGPDGKQMSLSEPGAPMLVTAPSKNLYNGFTYGIYSTDLTGSAGHTLQDCVSDFGGTSAASPVVAGVVALMLQANPNLTWRDVQHILVRTAEKNDAADGDWATNGAGYPINHKYGFGRVDAAAAVTLASTWTPVAEESSAASSVVTVNGAIPSTTTGSGITSSVTINPSILVEHVEVLFNASHLSRGDLEVTLTAPSGTRSTLMTRRIPDHGDHFVNWTFTTVRDWGELSDGTWTIEVVDRFPDANNGVFNNWQLKVYGTLAPPPSLSLPVDGANLVVNTVPWFIPTLTWNTSGVSGAARYELQLDTVNPPVTIINLGGTPNSYVPVQPLRLGTYYWRIRWVNGQNVASAWSQTHSFNIISPVNGAAPRNYDTTGQPTLAWSRVSGAPLYRVEVATDLNFTNVIFSKETPDLSAFVTPALNYGLYYWRVRAKNTQGVWSGWSPTESFIVDTLP